MCRPPHDAQFCHRQRSHSREYPAGKHGTKQPSFVFTYAYAEARFKGALQLLMNGYGYIRFAQVPERVSTKSFVVLIIGNLKSNHLGAQGTFKQFIC